MLRYPVDETDEAPSCSASPGARALGRGDLTHTGRHLGNFPRAFTHLALINAVMHVIATEESHDKDM